MKVEKATIKLVLRTNKVLADGSHPIMIRVNWMGKRAEKSCGFSCKKSQWNDTKACLKEGRDGIANAKGINIILNERVQKAENIRNRFILENKPYSVYDIVVLLDEELNNKKPSTELTEFKEIYKKKKMIRIETQQSINTCVSNYMRYADKKHVFMQDVTKLDLEAYGRWMKNEGYETNSIIVNLRNLSALFSYAVELELISKSPFETYKISNHFHYESHKQSISRNSIELFKQFYLQYVNELGDEKVRKDSLVIHSKFFAMSVFLISFSLQGLAMVDLANLTSDQMISQRFSDADNPYLYIVTKRSKTGREVQIAVEMDDFNYKLFEPYIEYMQTFKRLLPIFRDIDNTDKKRHLRRVYATQWANRNLKGYSKKISGYKPYVGIWREYNDWVKELVKSKNTKIKVFGKEVTEENIDNYLIDESTTFYAARHTFASIFINSHGATAGELAQLLGRNVSGIDRYIGELKSAEDVLAAREKMKIKG